MKQVFEYIDQHGATHCVRMRIPKDLKWAYPGDQDEILENLRTVNPAEEKARGYAVIARIKAEFEQTCLKRDVS